MKRIVLTVAGVVGGYALMVVLITLVQETWFGGVSWGETPIARLLLAGLLTCVAAAIGGAVATSIGRTTGRLSAVIMCCLVLVETTALVISGRAAGPLWFDAAAAASLIVAILIGAEIVLRTPGRSGRAASGPQS